jgi:Mg-chelatase subunit ChlD
MSDNPESPESPASVESKPKAEEQRSSRAITTVTVAVFVATMGAAIYAFQSHEKDDGATSGGGWKGVVTRTAGEAGGLKACDPSGKDCRALALNAEVPAGSVLRTDFRTRAELTMKDGSRLLLDRGTELVLVGDGQRRAKLDHGALLAEIPEAKGEARFDLPSGTVRVTGTKLAVRAEGPRAGVDVLRGSVALNDASGESVMVRAGETGRLVEGAAPLVSPTPSLADGLAWGEDAFGNAPEEREAHRGLGELIAKKPGESNERRGAVTLTSHAVRVRIAGAVARTEVEEVFSNQTDQVLEGIFRFPLPADAQIERLALDVDGKLEEGAFVDRERAAAIWRGTIQNAAPKAPKPREEIIWVPGPWKDPALLEWQRGGRFELRIFPIPKRGSRRVILAYTQAVPAAAGVRRYAYPLAYDPSGTTRVASFKADVEVRGHDARQGVRAHGYELKTAERGDAAALNFEQRDFSPSGDLSVEYLLPERDSELSAWTYEEAAEGKTPASAPAIEKTPAAALEPPASVDRRPFVAIALRPKLPRVTRESGQTVALVVDSSRSMYGEGARRATELASKVARELDPGTRLSVLACHTECSELPGGPLTPGADAAERVRRFLNDVPPEGGSDVVAAVRAAHDAVTREQGRSIKIVYVGDGAPTVGPVRPGTVQRAVARFVDRSRVSVTAVGVGAESDNATLRALARGGGGVMLPYTPGRTAAEMAFAVLGSAAGSVLSDVRVELPRGMSAMAPSEVDAIPAGGEAWISARLDGQAASGDVIVRGRVGAEPFEQRYRVDVSASRARGNAFVPRIFAAARIADLEREGTAEAKKEAVSLSSRFSVQSRHTSLLVLESAAMFKAFGLDNSRQADVWSGEEQAEGTVASGTFEADGEEDEAKLDVLNPFEGGGELGSTGPADGFGSSGSGRGGGGMASPKKKSAEAPMEAAPSRSAPMAPPRPTTASPAPAAKPMPQPDPLLMEEEWDRRRPRSRPMVPMRRIWERTGEIFIDRFTPKAATFDAVSNAERLASGDTPRREDVKKLYVLLMQSGDIERARRVAERWSDKEPLDPEALTARADVAARSTQRDAAIRILGSVIDVRPGDVAAHQRLARLLRWAGRPELGCRHLVGVAEIKMGDANLLAAAVRCLRQTGDSALGDELLSNADKTVRAQADKALAAAAPDDTELRGDIRLEATWDSGADLDLALIDPEGQRVSWLGAPTRAVIAARDVTSTSREALALRGGKVGDYVIEVVRAGSGGRARGELTVTVAGSTRRIPFAVDGDRTLVALARVSSRERLVPAGWN